MANIGANLKETKDFLDTIGCGMCVAKWDQVTIYLHNGQTHSCHHPRTHTIPLSELKDNPSALHNTKYKKIQRRTMLNGGRPEECDYCWNVEDNSTAYSDRIYKSSGTLTNAKKTIMKNIDGVNYLIDWKENINPTYVEVVCSYCAPHISTSWMEEIEKYGPYPTTYKFNNLEELKKKKAIPIPHREPNPYVEAFWKWWPDLSKDLRHFRITGGEPLLSKDTFKVLDSIIEGKVFTKKLSLSVNSNLMVPDDIFDKFIEKVNIIIEEDKVYHFDLFTSLDTWGSQSEYIRHGLEFSKFWKNCNKFLEECPKALLSFMVTYNALSVPNFDKFILGIYDLKRKNMNKYRIHPTHACVIDISYLRHPAHQSVKILPKEFREIVAKQAELMRSLRYGVKDKREYFTEMECSKLERIVDWMGSSYDKKSLNRDRRDFHRFFEEHDKRRGTNFIKIFPELKDFYENCSKIKVK